ncbi:MAG: peptidoglycan bridge formation glycyltransferase FemA/FemB family protein [Treponema sp.]|nr:peptidoglycan bridge formation glycyltransferase FemA/FemB family protein [Treponema sp.]
MLESKTNCQHAQTANNNPSPQSLVPSPYIKNITVSDLTVCEEANSFLQSPLWGCFKARFGWKALAFSVEWCCGSTKPLLVLCRRIAPGVSMAYVPWGPELPADFPADPLVRANAATELARTLRRFLPLNTTFIRFDFPWFSEGKLGMRNEKLEKQKPLKKAAADIQPPDTVIIDLTPPAEDILAAMKPKWRYNIGLAEKRGVTVSDSGEQGLETFYRLLVETAARDGIAIHNIDYYKALFMECNRISEANPTPPPLTLDPHSPLPTPHSLLLYTAQHEDDTLAAIVVLRRGKQATYLYGASANNKRNLMAPYALQWKAMQDAKAFGCTHYDLFGIPPYDDPHHPMAGLYRFKTGFGGAILHRPGSWDYPYKPLWYALFSAAEHLRKTLRDKQKKKEK